MIGPEKPIYFKALLYFCNVNSHFFSMEKKLQFSKNSFLPEFAFFVPGKYENFGDRKYARLKSCSSSANGDTNDGVNEAFGKKYSYSQISKTENLYFP